MQIKIKTDIPGPNSLKLSSDRSKNVANGHGSVCGVYIDKAEGSNLVDVDGNVFIDYAGGIGTMNVGHSHPRVIEAVEKSLNNKNIIGFVGAPWTLLVYMINQQSPKKSLKKDFFKDKFLINRILN